MFQELPSTFRSQTLKLKAYIINQAIIYITKFLAAEQAHFSQ